MGPDEKAVRCDYFPFQDDAESNSGGLLRMRMWIFWMVCVVVAWPVAESVPPQEFLREPPDQTAKVGDHVTLPCRVKNKRGMLQWTRDGFGLGVERNLTGFDRYHMSGIDEEGTRPQKSGGCVKNREYFPSIHLTTWFKTWSKHYLYSLFRTLALIEMSGGGKKDFFRPLLK